jgi:NAD(P)H dehydrogenase (quinone)
MEAKMFAITGASGQVGGAAARTLVEMGHKVRAVLRDTAKAAAWEALGAEIAIADMEDADSLTTAFAGADGVYVMVPPTFAPQPGYPEARKASSAIAAALKAARPGRVAALSSIGGGRRSGLGLITQVHILEEALAPLDLPVAILRPTWFMENSLWDVAPARDTGKMPSFLQPADRPFPLVATADIGKVAAETLTQNWTGKRVIEIEGPKLYTQDELAGLFGKALGRDVTAQPIPHNAWEGLFKSLGTAWPAPRIEMIDGFNSGWIAFEPGKHEHVVGETPFETVLADLVERS